MKRFFIKKKNHFTLPLNKEVFLICVFAFTCSFAKSLVVHNFPLKRVGICMIIILNYIHKHVLDCQTGNRSMFIRIIHYIKLYRNASIKILILRSDYKTFRCFDSFTANRVQYIRLLSYYKAGNYLLGLMSLFTVYTVYM